MKKFMKVTGTETLSDLVSHRPFYSYFTQHLRLLQHVLYRDYISVYYIL